MYLRIIMIFGAFLLISCNTIFYHPDRKEHFHPSKINMEVKDVFLTSQDGTKLHAWYFQSTQNPPKGIIVQFHGNAENLSSHFYSLVWLVQEGYDFFTFDYRGYGKSEGKPSAEGLIQDGLAALKEAWNIKNNRSLRSFIVVGQSLGGMIAMRSLSEFEHLKEVHFLVLDSTFSSYQEVASQKARSFWLTWPLFPLTKVLFSDTFSAQKSLDSLKMSKLIIHDRQDPVIDYQNAESLMKRLPDPKELWTLNQGAHVGVFFLNGERNRMIFLEKLSVLK